MSLKPKTRARFNGVAVRVHGIALLGPPGASQGDPLVPDALRIKEAHPHHHQVIHAAYSVIEGHKVLSLLWDIAAALPADSYARIDVVETWGSR